MARGKITHGHTRKYAFTPTYRSWAAMHTRCSNSKQKNWHLYGGKGIDVCERWDSFECFLADMGERPVGMTLDRKDSTGNYELSNCRWATPAQQSRNTQRTRLIEFRGERLCLVDWARKFGIGKGALQNRFRYGWSVERALTEPVGVNQGRHSAFQQGVKP